MTFVEHSLGESEHIYAKSNLKLETRCSVQISSSLGEIFPFSTLFQELDSLVSSTAWVARGNGLRISIRLVTNDFAPQHLDRESLIEGLSSIFCGGEFLKQLNLKAYLVLHLEDEDLSLPPGDLCFSLSHLRSTPNSAEKWDRNVLLPAHDIKQPFGVPFAFLEHIHMTFIFSTLGVYPNRKKRKLTNGQIAEPYVPLTDGGLPEYLNHSALSQYLLHEPKLLSFEHDRKLKSIIQQSDSIQDSRNCTTSGLQSTTTALSPSFQDCILSCSFQSLVEESPPMKLPMKRAASEFLSNEEKIVLADLFKLFDAGLRTMICGDRIEPLPGVTSLIYHSGPKLAEISPAVFRPGFLPAIWEHHRFFDTIAHTTSMIYSHKSLMRLRSKIGALRCFSPDEFQGNDMRDERMPKGSEDTLTNAVQVRLWRMTVSAILRRPGIATIKPLNWTDQSFVRSRDAQVMLEEKSSPSSGEVTIFESEEVDDALLFANEVEGSNVLLENELLFGMDSLDSGNDALNEDLWSGECLMIEALGLEEDWFPKREFVSQGAIVGARNVQSDLEGEILFEDDEDLLSDRDFPKHEHDSSMPWTTHQADYDEMLMDD